MDVAPAIDFEFCPSPHGGACYTSAPSSPTRLPEFYSGFEELLIATNANRICSLPTIPFAWEDKPGVPKTPTDEDFSFDVSCHNLDTESLPAEYLFAGGVIKAAVAPPPQLERERGRERGCYTSSRSRRTRSLSPFGKQMGSSSPAGSSENGSKKWSFLDLFRSVSDGGSMERDPLKKYVANFRKHDQDVRNSGSMSRRRGRVSAHEVHYNVNRAVSNDMKKKTYLPYKQGILGRLSFNPKGDF